MERYTTTISNILEVAEQTLEVRLKKPEGFDFEPGQFVMLELPQMGDEYKAMDRVRAMSIASAPREEEVVLVMRVPENPSDYKKKLQTLGPGDEVIMKGPMGHFTLENHPADRPAVFISGGVGIAPFRSMIVEEQAAANPRTFILIYANRTKSQATYLEELQNIELEGYRFVGTLTRETEEEAQKHGCFSGYITHGMIESAVKNPAQAIYYIVGTPQLVQASKALLQELEVPADQIKVEVYTGY